MVDFGESFRPITSCLACAAPNFRHKKTATPKGSGLMNRLVLVWETLPHFWIYSQ